jgi:hypothetical protein
MAYALRQSNMLYESMKIQGNTIIMVPSESLNSMGFGNLAMTIGYLDNVKNALKVGTRSAAAGASAQTKQPVSSSSTPAVEVTP